MLAAGSVNHVTACTTKYAAGIAIMSGKTLTISGSGSLTATGKGRDDGFGGAGIGGSLNDNAGNVVITGGTITATGGYGAAGIGGGNGGSYHTIIGCSEKSGHPLFSSDLLCAGYWLSYNYRRATLTFAR